MVTVFQPAFVLSSLNMGLGVSQLSTTSLRHAERPFLAATPHLEIHLYLIIVVLCGFQWFGCNQHLSPPNYHYLLCKTQQEPGVHIISSLSASHCGPAVCLCWGQEGSYSGCCGQRPSVYALPLLTAFSVCEV